MRWIQILVAALVMMITGCAEAALVGTRTDALDATAWQKSEWISAVDAPVVTGVVNSREGHRRAADGASWFLTTVKNPARVVSAQWMTTSLGVYELYLNGKAVGTDALKPGYTHPEKTRISYTYDILPGRLRNPLLLHRCLPALYGLHAAGLGEDEQEGLTILLK